jgi:hypothetical protein
MLPAAPSPATRFIMRAATYDGKSGLYSRQILANYDGKSGFFLRQILAHFWLIRRPVGPISAHC